MERTTGNLVDRAAARFVDRPWLHFDGRVTTFAELKQRSDSAAAEFLKLGVSPGDRVAFCAPNSPDLVFQWLGANKAGATFVPLNPAAPASEPAGVVERTKPRAMVLDSRSRAAAGLASNPPDAVPVAGIDEIAAGRQTPRFLPEVRAGDLAAFIATSGTTGIPKLVMHTHATYVLTAEGFPWWLGLGEADRLMTSLPLFHLNAQVYSTLGSLAAGAALVLLPRFSASRFWDEAAAHGATQVNAIGAMVEILMRRPERDVERNHRVRFVYTAPAFTEERHREIERRFGVRIVIGYGQSESPYGAIWPRGETPYGSMGKLRQHPELGEINQARIVDVEGADVARGETGELLLRNPAVMRGYFGMPEETEAALEGGWLHTGDLVHEDQDGYLYFVSRKKEVIRRRGENLSPAEVEAVLDGCPAVVESAVIGVPSELSDEDVKAFVIPGCETTAAELWAWCAARLAPFKVPRYIEFVDELPHSPTQRLLKRELPGKLTGREHDSEAGA
ncbi:MAG: AMP-binding protein [bacterium]|nr:AMP-binding protein [bacterium]